MRYRDYERIQNASLPSSSYFRHFFEKMVSALRFYLES